MYVFRAGFFLSVQSTWGCVRLAWQGENKRSSLAPRTGIGAIEPVENVRQIGGGDARAGVSDCEVYGTAVLPGTR